MMVDTEAPAAPTPTTDTPDPIALALRSAIFAEQSRLGRSERQLARHYGVGRMTLWRFKSGKLSPADRVLAALLINGTSPPSTP
jgi:helix-turn-helix, Psq domain